jgi:hypothetical protein
VVDIALFEREVHHVSLVGQAASSVDGRRRIVDADHGTLGQSGCEVDGDSARSHSDVEQSVIRRQMRQQVPGGVLGRSPPMRSQNRVVVPVGVDVTRSIGTLRRAVGSHVSRLSVPSGRVQTAQQEGAK